MKMITYYFSFFLFRYSSFALFKTLQDHDALACGTVRKLRAKFPATMVNKKLTRGEVIHMTKDGVVGMRLRDKKDSFFRLSPEPPLDFNDFKITFVKETFKNLGIDVSSRPKHGHFPQKIPPRESNAHPIKRCVKCYANGV